jgi:hypothetical protein
MGIVMLSLYHKHVSNSTISKIELFVGCFIDIYDINSHILPHILATKKKTNRSCHGHWFDPASIELS